MDGAIVQVAQDGSVVYRASALGGCPSALVYARLGYEPAKTPKSMEKVFSRGHEAEEAFLASWDESVWGRQKEIVLPVSSRVAVVGHVDGFRSVGSRDHLVEIKSQTEDAWEEFNTYGWDHGLFEKYKWQVSVYMHATGMPLSLVRVLWKNGEIARSLIHHVEDPFYSLGDIRTRVLLAESVAVSGGVSPCPGIMFPCPYFRLHEDADLELVGDEDLEAACVDYETARLMSKIAKEKESSARAVLVGKLGESGKKVFGSGVKVTTWEQKNPPSLRKELLGRWLKFVGGPNVERLFTQGKGTRVRVTLPKEDGEEIGQ